MVYGKFAGLLADYCTGVKAGDEVLISGTYEAYPLIKELWREVVSRGGYPRLNIVDEVLTEVFYKYAPESLLKYYSKIDEFIVENIDVRVAILSSTHTKPLVSTDPEKMKVRAQATAKLTEIFMRRDAEGKLRWVVTPFPTRALAQEAGMSPLEFEEFVFKALKLYSEDPVGAWTAQAKWQERIVDMLMKASELRFLADDTDLTVKVEGRKWINDDGKVNMPGGEIFTAPHEDSADGYIKFDYPAIWRGVEVKGVKLVFKDGGVTEARAEVGEEFLRKMLETDEGAKRIGELAFGLNYDITRSVKQILFDEKIGGTVHLALGSAYLKTGGKNKSAIHWDLIKGMEKGEVYADGELIYKEGKFIEEVL
jgi:aminopeptidase